MSSLSDMGPVSPTEPGPSDSANGPPSSANWREALMALIASRVALIQLESRDAAKAGARRGVYLLVVVGCVFFAWLLILAGTVSLLALSLSVPWSWIAISLAVVHLIIAIIFAKLAEPAGSPSFPHTRAEFQKDREWIENFQKTKKSND